MYSVLNKQGLIVFTALGMDPGTNNFAVSAVSVGLRKGAFEILTHHMVDSAVNDIKSEDTGERIKRFSAEIKCLKRTHKAIFVTAERFMTRGHGGTTIESISVMLGVVATVFGTEVRFITAANWKNAFNKWYNLDKLYGDMKPYGITNHQVDAVCIGLYGASLALEEAPFFMLTSIKQFKTKLINAR